MKQLLFIILALAFVLPVFGQDLEEKEVAPYCTATLMEDILKDKEIEYEEVEINTYSMKLNGYDVMMGIDEGDLLLRAYFTVDKPSFNRLNDFNTKYRWGRVYVDGDGDLVYAAELSFTGGIGLEGIYTFINTYAALLDKLSEHMD